MVELVINRGIPGSGKSTFARLWVSVRAKRVRVNRDDIRMQAYGVEFGLPIDENVVTEIQDSMIRAALKSGNSVIVDDCNIEQKYINRFAKIGHEFGADVRINQIDTPLATCIERNANRERFVPEDVIRKMHKRMGQVKVSVPESFEIVPYVAPEGKTKAILCDLDGTLFHMNGKRGPFDWQRVDVDDVDLAVLATINAMYADGIEVVFLSGRDGIAREKTLVALERIGWANAPLHMRNEKDMRKDDIVKYELFDKHVRDEYDVLYVLDDRAQVVRLWKRLGLKTFNVSGLDNGEF